MRTAKGIIVISVVLLLAMAGAASATVPRLMSFQGKLTNNADQPLTGNYDFTFRIYGAATGGAALWTEVQAGVAVETGIYNVLLGSVTPLNLAFDTGYWLSVEIGADGEMSPRYRLTSAPYSLYSDTANAAVSGGASGARVVYSGVFDTSYAGDTVLTADAGGYGTITGRYITVNVPEMTLTDPPIFSVFYDGLKGDTGGDLGLLMISRGFGYYEVSYAASWWGTFVFIEQGKIHLLYEVESSLQGIVMSSVLSGSKYYVVVLK